MMTRELAAEFKKACEEQECETCSFGVGIYMEGLDYTYYSCDLRKKPREYDIDKIRVKQTKKNRKGLPKDEKKTKRKKKGTASKAITENKEKKTRGKPKKNKEIM